MKLTKCLLTTLIVIGLIDFSITANAGIATSEFNFEAQFVGGGCSISVPSSLQFNNGNILLPSEIEAATEAGTPKTSLSFEVTLSDCDGSGIKPLIKVSGEKTTAFGSTLFRDASALGPSDSNGYGVYLKTNGNSSFYPNDNLAYAGYNSTITYRGSADDQLNNINTKIPIFAVLRCASCNYPGRQGGVFKSTLTFEFIYQ